MAMQWTPNQVSLLNLFETRFDQNEHKSCFISSVISERDYEEEIRGLGLRHNARFGSTLIQLGGQLSNSTGLGVDRFRRRPGHARNPEKEFSPHGSAGQSPLRPEKVERCVPPGAPRRMMNRDFNEIMKQAGIAKFAVNKGDDGLWIRI
jgi:hypothetical protein